MKQILVLYATREGQTRHIAEHLAATARERGLAADVVDAAHLPPGFELSSYRAAFLATPVHRGKHAAEMVEFVKKHLAGLEAAAFLSVSLTEASVEDPAAPPERHAQAAADVQRMIDLFLADTGWHPARSRASAQ